MAQGFGWYLDSIGRIPLLTPAEEIELGTAIRRWLDWPDGPDQAPPGVQRRGRRAKERFVNANLRLAVNYVKEHCSWLTRAGEFEDAIQAANLGLVRGVEKFDPTRGYKFSTYGYWWIRQSVGRHVDTSLRTIKLPGLHNQHIAKMVAAAQRFQAAHGRQPTVEELADAAALPVSRVEQLLEEKLRLTSLDMHVGDDGDDSFGDLVAAPAPIEPEVSPELEQLREHLADLPPIHQEVIALRWGFNGSPLGPKQIASMLGLRLGEVQQIERQALQQLGDAQQQTRSEQSQPERFAHRLGPQLVLLDLPRPANVIIARRRQTRRGGRRQGQLNFKGGDAPERTVDQLALLIPLFEQVDAEVPQLIGAG